MKNRKFEGDGFSVVLEERLMDSGLCARIYGKAPKAVVDAVKEINGAMPSPSEDMATACLKQFFKKEEKWHSNSR